LLRFHNEGGELLRLYLFRQRRLIAKRDLFGVAEHGAETLFPKWIAHE
jgi:hypothetical protein